LAQACRDDEPLTFDYAARGAETTHRRVEPHRLVSLGRRWYLVAYDRDRQDWRSFRVDRISSPATTGQRFRPRELPGGDALAFVEAGFRRIPQRYDVRVRVSAPVDRVRWAVGRWGEVTAGTDGTCLLQLKVDSLEWPVMILAQVGAPFEIESPDELRTEVGRVAALMAAAAR
jgi:predicted DNA-binding transcriptional regulator YafY